jgi:hypothetical protein
MCLIHIDEPTTDVNYCATVCLCVLSFAKLSRLYTPRTMHGSRNDTLRGEPRSLRYADYYDSAAPWGYKFSIHLMPIAISHPSLLLAFRVLLFPVVC